MPEEDSSGHVAPRATQPHAASPPGSPPLHQAPNKYSEDTNRTLIRQRQKLCHGPGPKLVWSPLGAPEFKGAPRSRVGNAQTWGAGCRTCLPPAGSRVLWWRVRMPFALPGVCRCMYPRGAEACSSTGGGGARINRRFQMRRNRVAAFAAVVLGTWCGMTFAGAAEDAATATPRIRIDQCPKCVAVA